MSIKTIQDEKNTTYFITFTCHDWIPLIETSESYNAFYTWFKNLNKHKIPLLAYVIMPNHFHGIVHIPLQSKHNINKIISNGKRFIAYEMIKSLQAKGCTKLLETLNKSLTKSEKAKNQRYKVFISSFDCKEIFSDDMFYTKLDYIHFNPVRGKWNLVEDYPLYKHSSAAFYENEIPDEHLTHFSVIFGDV
jgi:REP element-mobilizing transposase RayT